LAAALQTAVCTAIPELALNEAAWQLVPKSGCSSASSAWAAV